jgi:hypothetical protein
VKIKESLQRLRTHPHLGVVLEENELRRQEYRKLVCGNYLCFYRLINDTVYIYHIVDGRTEYKRLFRTLPE